MKLLADPTLLTLTGILAPIASANLTLQPAYNLQQRRWVEWAAWGVLWLGCRVWGHNSSPSSSSTSSGGGEVEDGQGGKEDGGEGSLSGNDSGGGGGGGGAGQGGGGAWTTTALAVLLVTAQYSLLRVGRADAQFCFPLVPVVALVVKVLVLQHHGDGGGSMPWYTRLFNHFEDRNAAVLYVGGWLMMPIGLVYSRTLDTLGRREWGMVVWMVGALAWGVVRLEGLVGGGGGGGGGYEVVGGGIGETVVVKVLQSISAKAFVFCTVYLALFSVGFPGFGALAVVMTVLRLVELGAVIFLCFNHAPLTASGLLVPAAAIISTINAGDLWTKNRFILVAAGSTHIIKSTLPKSSTSKGIYLLLLLPFGNWLWAARPNASTYSDTTIGPVHPIERLVDANTLLFSQRQAAQSKDVKAAAAEYKRRYGRLPPPGFDKWFEIAQENDFQFIDEFDTVMETLEPFWGVSPIDIRARLDSIDDNAAMELIEVSEKGLDHTSSHHYVREMMKWTNASRWGEVLPTTKFLFSAFDEPRVVAPYDSIEQAMTIASKQKAGIVDDTEKLSAVNKVKWIHIGKQGTWEAMISSCHINSAARTGISKSRKATTAQLPFVHNITRMLDVCQSEDLLHGHGLLSSPDTMILTHSLVPVFSQCKPSVFSDVLYPSPYYNYDNQYNPSEDSPWEEKLDRAYWAGSSTGGYNTPENWMTLQRQRLTLMTEHGSQVPVQLLQRDDQNHWQPRNTSYDEVSDLFYLRVTHMVQCAEEACQAMKEKFTYGDEAGNAALGSKYALDIDGNAYSGRYYKLLKSNSAVLKHTSFKEWHDGRLQPWVHFIPVSPGAEELGEIMRFLVNEEEGRVIGKRIAEQGKEWAVNTLRPIDFELVFVRVLMEYGRITSDERDKLGFSV